MEMQAQQVQEAGTKAHMVIVAGAEEAALVGEGDFVAVEITVVVDIEDGVVMREDGSEPPRRLIALNGICSNKKLT